ncbi:MAG: ferrous iron transport protein A [Candidatus Cloacimonadota bacterium]|nr:MAG: ferrous iron transport protein A [Candidatus Cloacimonadota bacterium]
MRTLSELKPGEKSIIADVSSDSKIKRKLVEMGITKGEEVEMIRVAPLGDPIAVEIRGYKLTIRKNDAKHIKIK